MEEETPQINSLVYQYLSNVSTKVAKLFKKECKTTLEDPTPGSPGLSELVKNYTENGVGAKRKLNDKVNGTPAKKAKMNGTKKGGSEESEDSSSDSESEAEAPKKGKIQVLNQFLSSRSSYIENLEEYLKDQHQQKIPKFENGKTSTQFKTTSHLKTPTQFKTSKHFKTSQGTKVHKFFALRFFIMSMMTHLARF